MGVKVARASPAATSVQRPSRSARRIRTRTVGRGAPGRSSFTAGATASRVGVDARVIRAPMSLTVSPARAVKEKPTGVPKASKATKTLPSRRASMALARVSSPRTRSSLENQRNTRR